MSQVEAKKAVPKEEQQGGSQASSEGSVRTKKIFVGGLAPAVDEKLLRQYFEQFGTVEDAVVMYDHDNKRPRGFGFVTFAAEESVDKVFGRGVMQTILEKQIEIKPAVPRDQMPNTNRMPNTFYEQQRFAAPRGAPYGYGMPPYGNFRQFGPGPRSPYMSGVQGMGPGRGRGHQNFPQGPLGAQQQGPAGMQRYGPGYPGGNMTKVQMAQGGYDLYGAAGLPNGNIYSTNSQALYNQLAGFQPAINGLQSGNKQLNTFNANNIANLAKLGALASSFGAAFPTGQSEGFQSDSNQYTTQEVADFAAAEAAVNGANLATVATDFNTFHDTGFSGSPAPGWSAAQLS